MAACAEDGAGTAANVLAGEEAVAPSPPTGGLCDAECADSIAVLETGPTAPVAPVAPPVWMDDTLTLALGRATVTLAKPVALARLVELNMTAWVEFAADRVVKAVTFEEVAEARLADWEITLAETEAAEDGCDGSTTLESTGSALCNEEQDTATSRILLADGTN